MKRRNLQHWLPIGGLIIFCLFFSAQAFSQSDKVDEYIKAEMQNRQIPGLALAVVKNGEVVKIKGYGFANLETELSATPDTVFELASVTKQFTAAAVMLLVEEGKIKLDDSITNYIPDAPDKWKPIKIRHLLTQTSGLGGFTSLYENGGRLNYSTTQMFEAAAKPLLSFAPGEDWAYTDVNYFLLGMILEKVSGQRYGDFLQERFFKPLGMTSTTLQDQTAIIKNRAASYTLVNNRLVNNRRVWQFELSSAFGVLSTVKDLAKWEIALGAGKVIKPESLRQMWTPVKFNDGGTYTYGFGWEIGDRIGHLMLTHKGITGVEYTRFPNDNLTVIVLTNLGDRMAQPAVVNSWNLTKAVAGRFLPDLLFTSLKEQAGANQQLTLSLKDFLSRLAGGEDSPLMTPELRKTLGPAAKNNTAKRLNELKSFNFLRCDDRAGKNLLRNGLEIHRSCYYKMITGADTFFYTFWLTTEGKVADFGSQIE